MTSLRDLLHYLETSQPPSAHFDPIDAGWPRASNLISLYRQLWAAIPLTVFDPRCHDSSGYVVEVARRLFGDFTPEDERVTRVLLMRVRQYVVLGRRTKSRPRAMIAMLRDQLGRCSTCGYRFKRHDIDAYGYADEVGAENQISGLNPPHVDHRVPVFIGGDSRQNLQVLCRECNLAKGTSLSWMTHRSWVGRFGPSDLQNVTAGERWVVLDRDRMCTVCGTRPLDLAGESRLTVVRHSDVFGWVLENLRTRCTECVHPITSGSLPD